MLIEIPELAMVALISAGVDEQTLFLNKYFKQEEICTIEEETVADQRLKEGQLVVMPILPSDTKSYDTVIQLSKKNHVPLIGIWLRQSKETDDILQGKLHYKTFKKIYRICVEQGFGCIKVLRKKLSNNKKDIHGPFDIIGDIHGCYEEFCELIEKLGYEVDRLHHKVYATTGRKLVLCGDLVDRGPKVVDVLKLVMQMVEDDIAYAVLGNHDGKLLRKLKGANVQVMHGLEITMAQLDKESDTFRNKLKYFLEHLVSHYVFDDGKLVVAHAGLKADLHGRESHQLRNLAMFGETTGELDEHGLPARVDWSKNYKGEALVVYGHTPRKEAKLSHHTINIDTGCVYGGRLTAFRYPEYEIVDVAAKETYYASVRPFL